MFGHKLALLLGIVALGFFCCSAFGVGVSDKADVESRLNGKLIRLSGFAAGGKTRGSDTGFWFGTEKVTWDTAKSYCQQAGLTLLVIQNELKQMRFEAYLAATDELGDWSSGGAWLAGTDRHSSTGGTGFDRFYWSPVGNETIEMLYQNFRPNGNTIGDGCVVISNANVGSAFGTWWAKSCTTFKTVYFCESRY